MTHARCSVLLEIGPVCMKKKKHLSRHTSSRKPQKDGVIVSLYSRTYMYGALGVIGVIAFLGLAQTFIQAASLQYDSPDLVAAQSQSVLGDDEGKEEENKQEEQRREEEKKGEEQRKEEGKRDEEQRREENKPSESRSNSNSGPSRPAGLFKNVINTVLPNKSLEMKKQQEGIKRETEIETADGQKIKTKVEDDGTTKVEIEHGELKLKYKVVNGQVVKKVEDENGDEVELEDAELDELEKEEEQELEDRGIEIASRSGRPAVVRRGFAAGTQFPLSVDVGTNQLIVTTPAGQKAVTVLPDKAVQNLLETGIINRFDSTQSTGSAAPQGGVAAGSEIELKVRNGEPVYEVNGIKTYRLFSLFPISQPLRAVVSAETGEVITTQKSFLTNVIDILSP